MVRARLTEHICHVNLFTTLQRIVWVTYSPLTGVSCLNPKADLPTRFFIGPFLQVTKWFYDKRFALCHGILWHVFRTEDVALEYGIARRTHIIDGQC